MLCSSSSLHLEIVQQFRRVGYLDVRSYRGCYREDYNNHGTVYRKTVFSFVAANTPSHLLSIRVKNNTEQALIQSTYSDKTLLG